MVKRGPLAVLVCGLAATLNLCAGSSLSADTSAGASERIAAATQSAEQRTAVGAPAPAGTVGAPAGPGLDAIQSDPPRSGSAGPGASVEGPSTAGVGAAHEASGDAGSGIRAGAASAAGTGQPSAAPQPEAPHAVLTGRLVVKPAAPASTDDGLARQAAEAVGGTVDFVRRTASGAALIGVTGDVEAAARHAAAAPGVEYAVPEHRVRATMTPNDPSYASQWDLPAMHAPHALDYTIGAGVTVAVVDTGALPHPDLAGRYLPGYDFVSDTAYSLDGDGRDADATDAGDWVPTGFCGDNPAPISSSWHGLHVAGTIAALTDNGAGVAGLAPGARILPVRVLARCGGLDTDIADGIRWAAGAPVPGVPANPTPARIINLSLGGTSSCSPETQTAIDAATARGALVVVAAGNDGGDVATYSPANCSGVLVVGATDWHGQVASYANRGPAVTLSAPGSGIVGLTNLGQRSADPLGWSVITRNGTSMATPHVSAVAALVWSLHPTWSAAQVKALLLRSVVPFAASSSGAGAGILDAGAAVDQARPAGVAGPTVTLVDPAGDRMSGGDPITLYGAGLTNAAVTIGGIPATVTASSGGTLTVIAPPGPVGASRISVVTPGGRVTLPFFYDTRRVPGRQGPVFTPAH